MGEWENYMIFSCLILTYKALSDMVKEVTRKPNTFRLPMRVILLIDIDTFIEKLIFPLLL